MHAVALQPIERPVRRGRGGDARDDAELGAGKFGIPAAPLLMTVRRPAAKEISRSAARHVWVEANTSMPDWRRVSASHGRLPASSSASCAKPQPASEVASPCTMPTRKGADLRDQMRRQLPQARARRRGDAAAQALPISRWSGARHLRRRCRDRRSRSRRRCRAAGRSRFRHCRGSPGGARRRARPRQTNRARRRTNGSRR